MCPAQAGKGPSLTHFGAQSSWEHLKGPGAALSAPFISSSAGKAGRSAALFPCHVSVLLELLGEMWGWEQNGSRMGAAVFPSVWAGPDSLPVLEEHERAWRCLSPK